MTRQEEIQNLIDEEMGIDNYGSCDFQVGVIYGVKYADKTMIEKILQWLKSHIKFETVTYSDVWDISVVDILATDFATVDEMEESLRKVMEE